MPRQNRVVRSRVSCSGRRLGSLSARFWRNGWSRGSEKDIDVLE